MLSLLVEDFAPLVNTTGLSAGPVALPVLPLKDASAPPAPTGDLITGQLVNPEELYPSGTTFRYQGSAGSDVVAFGAGLGNERVLLSASSGPQAFRDGRADTIIWNFANPDDFAATGNVKEILGFEFGAGSDVIAFAPGLLRDEDGNTLSSQVLSRSVLVNINAASTNLATAATERVFIQFGGTGELRSTAFAGATTAGGGASAAALIGTRSVSASQRLLFAFDDGSDSYLWYFNNGLGAIASRAETAELALVGVVRGVTGFSNGDLTMANQALLSLNLPGTAGADSLVGGSGTDVIRPLAGDDRVVAGAGSDIILLDPGAGTDDLYLGAFTGDRAQAIDGAADRVVWNYTLPANLAAPGHTANIVGFQSGSDVLEFVQGLLAEKNGITSAGRIGTTLLNLSASADLLGSNGIVFHQLAGVGDLTAAAAANSTSVAARLSGWNVESNTRFLFAVDDGSDSYLWYCSYNGNASQKNVIDANELRLIATLRQITALASGDLRVAASTVSPTATVPRTADVVVPTVAITAIGGTDSTVSSQLGDNTVVGSAEAGRNVTLAFNGTTLGSTTATASGAFSYTLTAANLTAIGQGAGKAITASQADDAGNTGSSSPFSFSVDTAFTGLTISAIGGSDATVSSQPGDNTITGLADPGLPVSLLSSTTVLGNTTADAAGNYTYTLTAANLELLGQGAGRQISASQENRFGRILTTPAFSFAVDTIAPALAISAIGAADTTVSGQSGDNTVVGSAEAGRSVTLTFNGATLGSTTASATGAFAYTLTAANLTAIGQGAGKAITASQSDAAGNTGSSSPFSFSVDTLAPEVVITAIGGADSTVTSQAGDNTVVGSAEAGRSVTLAFNGTTLGSTTSSTSGAFSYTLTAANLTTIGQGAGKAISASQADAAGNIGRSSPFSFSVDTTPPPPPTDDFAGGTGTTGTVTVGSSSSGNLERNGDRDWFRISLEGGRRYAFRLNGVTLADPQLRLLSDSGLELVANNDANNSLNAEILFDSIGTGIYYLEAAAPGDLGTGTYTLSASDITLAEPPRPYSSTDGYGEISVVRALDQLTGQRLTRQPALGGVFWGLDRVGAPTAWAAGITGAGITVAVIDTGVDYLHPDIDANIWTNTREIAGNGIDDDNNGFIDDIRGWDFAYNDNDPSDVNGHGTHVAGTIAAENNGFGQIGVAYNARIMPVKVLSDTGSGSFSNVARGIRYAADNGADVINLSLGGTSGSFELLEAIRYASSRGSLLLMSAGNSSMTTPGFPAAYASETGLAIGAVDISGTFASFSNQAGSAEIDYVTAPGVNVYSLSPNNAYRSLNGTSMAAPHVAGVAALLLSYRPELTPVQLESLLISTTKPSADALATPSAPQAPAGGITAAFAEEASLIELPWIDDDDSDFGGDHADSESDGDDNNRDLEIDVATDAIKGLLPDELTITSTVAASPASSIASDLQDAGINDSQSAEIVQMVFSNAIGDFGPMAGKAPSVDDLADPSTLLRRLRHLFPDEDPLEVVRRVWSRTHPQRWPSP
jgi:hypothetical protein